MATVEWLEGENAKVWQEITALKDALAKAVSDLTLADESNTKSISNSIETLQATVNAVKAVAEAKTPEDVTIAHEASLRVIALKKDAETSVSEINEVKGMLPAAKKTCKVIQGRGETIEVQAQKVQELQQKAEAATKSATSFLEELTPKKVEIDQKMNAATTAANTATAQAQEVCNLKAKASDEYSEIEAVKSKLEELKTSLDELNEQYRQLVSDSTEKFEGLHSDYNDKFGNFFGECKARFLKLSSEIEGLLPGATSLALETAFDQRKKAVQKNKWWWATLLIASAVGIVCFGWWSLAHATAAQTVATLPLRLVIIAGFVILEEFARRNYNISVRLAEAYAYKEAIAKSYLGFKKELAGTKVAGKSDDTERDSETVLARTFLQKLDDEPGKRVFEKERRAYTLLQTLGQIVSANNSEGTASEVDKAQMTAAFAAVFSRVTWPLVAVVLIVAIAGCFVTYMLVK